MLSIRKLRSSRIYDPPDVEGYFENYAWPAYLQHEKEISDRSNDKPVQFLDAEQLEDNYHTVFCDILHSLTKDVVIICKHAILTEKLQKIVGGGNSGAVVSFEGGF